MNLNIFREYDIRGMVEPDLDDKTVELIGKAAGTWFRRNNARRIALGFDCRSSSPHLADVLTNGLLSAGCDVISFGMVPTPVLYYALFSRPVDGGVMITGSHNPPDHNGFKACLGQNALFGPQILEIRDIAISGDFAAGSGIAETGDVLAEYLAEIVSKIKLGERRLKVAVDAGNGMGGVSAVPVYRNLDIDVIELFTNPDPAFPNHHPDPTVAENLQDLIHAVRTEDADLGLAFDGDADRLGVVDENGRIIWGDELMVLFARSVLLENPGGVVVAEAKCSQNLFNEIEKSGGVPLMWKAGHSIIKAKMKETGAVLGGEMSGHFFFADRFYGFDDGCYAGARLLEILSRTDRPLSELFGDIPKTYSTPELRTPCDEERKFEVVKKIADYFSENHAVITIDGARIIFEHGWGIVRASNTQAILVSRFEADSEEHLNEIRSTVEAKVSEFLAG